MNNKELLARITRNQKNVKFNELERLLAAFGFGLARSAGSHRIYTKPGVPEFVNVQEVKGEAKPYQVKQFLKVIEITNLKLEQ